jgi:hypothetical protein
MSAAHSHGSPRSLAEETPEPAFLFPLADSTSGAHRDAGMADIPNYPRAEGDNVARLHAHHPRVDQLLEIGSGVDRHLA